MAEHEWPFYNEHLWGPWIWSKGLPMPSQYRKCVHPKCKGIEERKGSRG